MKNNIARFRLDPNNQDFFRAFTLVNNTRKNIFLTGKAGTGKTTFLNYVKENSRKNLVITSYTGIAAVNAGGVTLNSLFQIPPSVYPPGDPRLRTKAGSESKDKSTNWDHFQNKKEKRKDHGRKHRCFHPVTSDTCVGHNSPQKPGHDFYSRFSRP
ncbi:MAG: hypothetical protein ACP5D1_11210 [Bacteroidales bacterium]